MTDAMMTQVAARVAGERRLLESVSREIHAHPELCFQEHRAAGLLVDTFRQQGWEVEAGAGGLETAFVATAPGSREGGPTVAVLAEYDALPGLGHGCAHNLIAAVALGAGIGAAPVLGATPGRLLVIGTPAEEGGNGKSILLDHGVFDGVDAVLAFHATNGETRVSSAAWAAAMLDVSFHGKAAHAAADPWAGVNALDAMILFFSSIGLMRQQLPANARVHGIITNGGQAFNVIPELTAATVACRSYDTALMYGLAARLRTQAEAAALATGCRVQIDEPPVPIEGILANTVLATAVEAAAGSLGYAIAASAPFPASTDFGNVSQAMASAQLEFACLPAPLHTHGVTDFAATDAAHDAMVQAAQILATAAARLLRDPELIAAARAEFTTRRPPA